MNKKKVNDHSRIPLAELIQEGCDKHYMCTKDKQELLRWGIDWQLVEKLPELTSACSNEETEWQILSKEKKGVTAELKEMLSQGRKVRTCLAQIIRKIKLFKESGHKLPAYRDRRRQADIIEDLYDLFVLCNKLLGTDPDCIPDSVLVGQALSLHNSIREQNMIQLSYRADIAECLQRRNTLAKELKKIIDYINDTGQNAFIDNPAKAVRYTFFYYRELNNNRKAAKEDSAAI